MPTQILSYNQLIRQRTVAIETGGVSGYSGISGYGGPPSGYSGYSGISGMDGAASYSGYSGTSGYVGTSGVSGYSGYSGQAFVGSSGYSGKSGVSGATAASGYSGYSGLSGLSGYSGYSGLSGVGTSGYSGAPSPDSAYGLLFLNEATAVFTPSTVPTYSVIPNLVQGLTSGIIVNAASGYMSPPTNGVYTVHMDLTFAYYTPTGHIAVALGYPNIINFALLEGAYATVEAPAATADTVSVTIHATEYMTTTTKIFPLISINSPSGNVELTAASFTMVNVGAGGDSGYSGYSGKSGFSGYSGKSGYSGQDGSDFVGSSGYSGKSGYSGTQGLVGSQGLSGVSGYSGYSGSSGYSGIVPAWNTFSSTLTGFSGYTSATIWYLQIGKIIFVNFYISGISNATTTTMTLPVAAITGTVPYFVWSTAVTDNGIGQNTSGSMSLAAGSSTANLYKTYNSGAWTNIGTKTIYGMIWYQTA
jgi:hypothetical protein